MNYLLDFNKPDIDKIDKCIEEIKNGGSFMAALHKIEAEDVAKYVEPEEEPFLAVGEVFEHDGVILRVEESGICADCYGYDTGCIETSVGSRCSATRRKDNIGVSFVEVPESEIVRNFCGTNVDLILDPAEDDKVPTYTDRLQAIVNHFGVETQIDKTIEELLELALALKSGTPNDIEEERADVTLMLEQLELIFGSCQATKDSKLIRTEKRIEEGYYET